jgi:hypothetical protein
MRTDLLGKSSFAGSRCTCQKNLTYRALCTHARGKKCHLFR